MKGSDFIARHLRNIGVDTSFVLTGGCIIHFIDSLATTDNITYIPMLHEQSCAMAADAYARITGKIGVTATTSGPGATNLLTGLCCSFYDSIPVLHITGQVHSSKLKNKLETRQFGFQETDVVSIYKSVTKYCAQVSKPELLEHELNKAIAMATSGRKGPVLLDITEDVLYSEFVPSTPFNTTTACDTHLPKIDDNDLTKSVKLIQQSARPVLVLGAGALGVDKNVLNKFVNSLGIPVLLTWGAFELMNVVEEFFVGGFGVTSRRSGNFIIQKSDLILAIGTRFDTHEIGNNPADFSPLSRRIVVDIDPGEISKYSEIGFRVDISFIADSSDFIVACNNLTSDSIKCPRNVESWFTQCKEWDHLYPILDSKSATQKDLINPYSFFNKLSNKLSCCFFSLDNDCLMS